ncbi:hypothetical protein PIROE2DRAFT_6661 [Piromyces sp. E2]|nr:hypothetical protein PIROE2DRAFT_6661 [Piromyces sp. E2]|eukprot:OUM66218.1 hypothetical protein PIROE2DRAFT_6661 [Piromyces sp. E2]
MSKMSFWTNYDQFIKSGCCSKTSCLIQDRKTFEIYYCNIHKIIYFTTRTYESSYKDLNYDNLNIFNKVIAEIKDIYILLTLYHFAKEFKMVSTQKILTNLLNKNKYKEKVSGIETMLNKKGKTKKLLYSLLKKNEIDLSEVKTLFKYYYVDISKK